MENYLRLKREVDALIDENASEIGNLANVCSYVYNSLPNINWVGIYVLKDDKLFLGPFMGKPACTIIPITKGICGRAVRENRNIIISDVEQECDHIACDNASKSEQVLILHRENKIWGVLDVDAPIQNRFDDRELNNFFIEVAHLIESKVFAIPRKA